MAFPVREAQQLLADCHRRCCICHRFCGVKMELDHIVPRSDGGGDEIENAIPVCFECHAEIHLYNDRHPRGRKFQPDELEAHKRQWLEMCRQQPSALVDAQRVADVGPLQALIDELEFNIAAARSCEGPSPVLCAFEAGQFNRAMSEGILSLLGDDLKMAIHQAYVHVKAANVRILGLANFSPGSNSWGMAWQDARQVIGEATPYIDGALILLRQYLSGEHEA